MGPYRSETTQARPATSSVEFAAFYECEFLAQFRVARLITGSSPKAEDVVHDAFVSVWSRWGELDEPGPYLCRCVVNGARTVQSQVRERRMILDRFRPTTVERQSEREVLTDVLAELPFNQRSAIVLRYYAGLTESEIAAAVDSPVGSVGPWIHRGLEQLRKALS